MNAVARAQLTFQMLTLLQNCLYRQSQYSTTWESKCLALIAQMVSRAFGMNPKVGGSSTPSVEIFSVSKKIDTPVLVSKINAVPSAQLTFQMLILLKKYTYVIKIYMFMETIKEASLYVRSGPEPPMLISLGRSRSGSHILWHVNLSTSSNAHMSAKFGHLALAQIMVCCLFGHSHYPNQC